MKRNEIPRKVNLKFKWVYKQSYFCLWSLTMCLWEGEFQQINWRIVFMFVVSKMQTNGTKNQRRWFYVMLLLINFYRCVFCCIYCIIILSKARDHFDHMVQQIVHIDDEYVMSIHFRISIKKKKTLTCIYQWLEWIKRTLAHTTQLSGE